MIQVEAALYLTFYYESVNVKKALGRAMRLDVNRVRPCQGLRGAYPPKGFPFGLCAFPATFVRECESCIHIDVDQILCVSLF
jgi:hypothetical protein